MQLPSFKKTYIFHDTHEKSWGGVYAKRIWKKLLILAFVLLLLSAGEQYNLYVYYTRPVIVSQQVLTQEVVNLDLAGLNKAVSDIKDKEMKFTQYRTQKVQIADPAK